MGRPKWELLSAELLAGEMHPHTRWSTGILFGPRLACSNVRKVTDKASVVRAETQEAFDILRCLWGGPGAYSLDLLGVGRYTMIAHHMAKKRNGFLKENALFGAQFEACIT